jgi:hypothetical protein
VVVTATALVSGTEKPDRETIRSALTPHLCRRAVFPNWCGARFPMRMIWSGPECSPAHIVRPPHDMDFRRRHPTDEQALAVLDALANHPSRPRENHCGSCRGPRRSPAQHRLDKALSTNLRPTGIRVDVHSGLPPRI